jgi:S-(hydroxymethyl)glutathione dehydrogenase/alcohol dehydrogenase
LKFEAAILVECKKPLEITTIELKKKLDLGQVLVELKYSGVCGKQVEEYLGKMGPDRFLPHLLGHEGYGIVVDKHPSVKKVNIGDQVVMHWVQGSGIQSNTPEYDLNGRVINAGWITTFNEYAVVSENRITPLVVDIKGDVACLLGCAITTGVGVVVNESNTRPHHKVAIIGCGGVGLNCISGSKLVNAQLIDVYDINPSLSLLAISYGADNFFEIEKKQNYKYDKVFVTAPYANAIEFGVEICQNGGAVYVVGVPSPQEYASISALSLHRNVSIHGSSGGGIVPERDIPLYYNFYTKDLIKVNQGIEKIIKLSEINKTITAMINGSNVGRHVIKF